MKNNIYTRILAAVMAGVMCCSMLPTTAFAEDGAAESNTEIVQDVVEEPADSPDAELPDKTAPPADTDPASNTDTSAPTSELSAEAKAFVKVVDSIDREAVEESANTWGNAYKAWEADPGNETASAELDSATENFTSTSSTAYMADEVYMQLTNEDKKNESVVAAYGSLTALFASIASLRANPTHPSVEVPKPTEIPKTETYDGELPDDPTGSYIGSVGLPVDTGDTKVSIAGWNNELMVENTGHLEATPLDIDNIILVAEKQPGKDFAIVPISAQVEYPEDGSSSKITLDGNATLLAYAADPTTAKPAGADESSEILNANYSEVSAAATGFYVKADSDFTAAIAYTSKDGVALTKTLHVMVVEYGDSEATMHALDKLESGAMSLADRPTPSATTGKITAVKKVGGTWLIWFNGQEAYCCSHGLDGQPAGCPTYGFAYTSVLQPGQYTPGNHLANQINIWGALGQLNLELMDADPVDDAFSVDAQGVSAASDLMAYCERVYDDEQMRIINEYPDSEVAQIYLDSAKIAMGAADGVSAQVGESGYYTYIYTPPISGWQTVALIGPPVTAAPPTEGETPPPDVPIEYYSGWSVGPQSASDSFDLTFGVNTDKYQLETLEKVDGAVIEIEPLEKSGEIDGGTWEITPADKQTVTTAGHTQDDSFQDNGGDASASWSLSYSVTKTTSGGASGQVGPFTSQADADDAASSEEDNARSELEAEAQSMVDAAMAAAQEELSSLLFRYEETGVPYGFNPFGGELGSNQTITVPADSNDTYRMRNDEWSLQVNIKKTDSETGNQIANDAVYEIYEWDVVTQQYIPSGGYNRYTVERQGDGTYAVINSDDYVTNDTMRHTVYFTQRNEGKFVIVETQAPAGYFGDWTNVNAPGEVGATLGKRAYYVEITKAKDGSVIWLDNSDYNADIATSYTGGTKLLTSKGTATTVTIGAYKDANRTYNTDNSDTAANENSYAMSLKDGLMQNDRTLGEISLSKVDLDGMRYVAGRDTAKNAIASGQAHADATLDGAVYDLYVAESITHPDGVSGVVDYSKILNKDGNPVWHTTIRDNAGQWVSDYLPVLAKDHLVASATIKNGWLTFANLYLGKYYIVERSTGVVIPLSDNAFVMSGTYPAINAKTKQPTGEIKALAIGNGQYSDWVYKNQFSNICQSKALDGTKTYDGYYISFAEGYLADEHNYYISPSYVNEGYYVEKTAFVDNRQAGGENLDKTGYSANYHIIRDNDLAESDDQVMKGNVELSKVISSTGSSNGIELERAGFTFYLISDLSKKPEFTSTRTGVYKLNSILSAYINAKYDQSKLKYDFTGETQAIAKTYEVDASEIAAYNQTLTEAGDYKNGVGAGWVATGRTNEYQLSEIFSNDTGNIRVQGLPYGQYLVVETTTPKDVLQAEPFIVTVDPTGATVPQSAMADPKEAAIAGSGSYQKYTVLDEEMEVYLRIIKKDEETGEAVLREGTAFQIYWIDENGNYILNTNGKPRLVTMAATLDGSVAKKVDTFYTNAEGNIALPEKLPLGRFRIVEITGPEGFYNEWISTTKYDKNGILLEENNGTWNTGNAYVDFTVTTDRIYAATGDDNEDSQDTLVIEESYYNNETLGKLTIRKMGEVLIGYSAKESADTIDPEYTGEVLPGKFTYEERPLAGAEYTITAAADVFTQDNQTDGNGNRHLWYDKGDIVAVVTTGDGTSDISAFAPSRTQATYDFLSVIHDGTIGEVSVTLPLGSYHIEETKPPYGYVGTSRSYDVTFTWDDQTNEIVMASTITNHREDGAEITANFEVVNDKDATSELKEDQVLVFHNDREKARVGVFKQDIKTKAYLAGAVFALYTDDDIYNADGKRVFKAGDLIANSPETVADGYTYFNVDVPIRGEYYGRDDVYIPTKTGFSNATNSGKYSIVEIRPPEGYFLNEKPMHVTFTYDGEALQVLDSTCENEATVVEISKRKITGDEELPGATLTILDRKGNVVREWVSTEKPTEIRGLLLGQVYTLVETRPADGYALASDIKFKLEQKEDAKGNPLKANDVYVLTGKDWLIFDHWTLMEDGMVVMRDDITRVQISKQDITNKEELPGAHLTITDSTGKVVEDWVSDDKPHYIEMLPAGDYTLTEVSAPNGYEVAEEIKFTVKPTGEIQKVVMYDKPITPDTPHHPEPTPTPESTPSPTPEPTPVPTPSATPTPIPYKPFPQTGDLD